MFVPVHSSLNKDRNWFNQTMKYNKDFHEEKIKNLRLKWLKKIGKIEKPESEMMMTLFPQEDANMNLL